RHHVFFLFRVFVLPRPPTSPLFPYTTLFRSHEPDRRLRQGRASGRRRRAAVPLRPAERRQGGRPVLRARRAADRGRRADPRGRADRKSTRLNSSHVKISYAVFCLKKKNADATYQRLVKRMFSEQLGKMMEVYIDDIHRRARSYYSSAKCMFAVAACEFRRYLVTYRGIKANPKQIDALIEMASPKTKREVQRLTERVTTIFFF